jgi:hypothetical protein
MPQTTIRVQASVALANPIILATRATPTFEALDVPTTNGHVVRIELAVDEADLRAYYEQRRNDHAPAGRELWITSRVDRLNISLTWEASDEDLMRLEGRHPSAAWHTVNGRQYQKAPDFAEQLGLAIKAASDQLVDVLRFSFGQYWLRRIETPEAWSNFLVDIVAKWSRTGGDWQRIYAGPRVSRMGPIALGVAHEYLTTADWVRIHQNWPAVAAPSVGFALVAEARDRYRRGDLQLALIHLSSAVEWGTQRFLERHLAPAIPDASLRVVLKQSHGRLLNDWLLPLIRREGTDLERNEWPDIKRIQELRASAGHPDLDSAWQTVTEDEFERLADAATRTLSKLLAVAMPKSPTAHAGDVGAFWQEPVAV